MFFINRADPKKPLLRQSDSKSLHQAMKPLRHVRKNSRHKTLPVIGSLFVVGGKPRLAAYAGNCVALERRGKKNDHHCPRLRSWY
jgi:hypothetical protein